MAQGERDSKSCRFLVPAGSNLFPMNVSAFPGSPQLRCVMCSHWGVCRLSLDTNYLREIWAAEKCLLFVVICCVIVSRWHPLVGAEVGCDFKI